MALILKVDKGIRKFCEWLSFAGAIWIFIIMLIITYDVIAKNFFNSSFVGASEIVRNSIVGIAFFMIPWATATLSHVRTTVIVDRVNYTAAKVLNIISYTLGFILFVAIVASSWEPFVSAVVNKEYEMTGGFNWPNWPIRAVIILGSVLSAWICAVYVLQQLTSKRPQESEEDKLLNEEGGDLQ